VIETYDPRTNELIGTVPDMGPEEVATAIDRARGAFAWWSRLSFAERAEHLLAVRDRMLDRLDDIVDVIVRETGRPEAEVVASEILPSCELIAYYAKHGEEFLTDRKVAPGMLLHKKAMIRYEPLGVVGVISPWNYPFILAFSPVVTALFAGNTVVLKPSEVTPLVGLEIGKLFDAAGVFPDIVGVVTGAGGTGEALVRGGVQKIAFTGSSRTGTRVMQAAAESLTPVLLELGGKDPMIVLDDADVERAASGAVWGSFFNNGQTCMAVERVYVADAVYDEFVAKVTAKATAVRQGHGGAIDIGSMTFPHQLDVVEDHVADAVAKGANVVAGGQRTPGETGLFYEPTVLVDVDHSMKIMTDETFGPVLPIMRVHSDDEALKLANDSRYGLNSSVWTTSPERADRFVAEIEAGNICVNDCIVNYAVASLPFGGVKQSGFGRAHGEQGLREFTVQKAVLTDRGGLKREPTWYPTPRGSATVLSMVARLRYRRGVTNKLKSLIGR